MIRPLLFSIATLAAVLVITGFLGHMFRGFDTVALGRPAFGVLCILGVVAARSLLLQTVFGLTALAALATTIVFLLPQASGPDLRIYAKNLWFANDQIPALVADIESADVDAVMVQEVSNRNEIVLELLGARFPHQHYCKFSTWSGIAVLSRHPFDGTPVCSNRRAIAAAPVQVNGTRVWLVSAHIPWHWPADSAKNETAAVDLLAGLNGAIVMGGDFNSFPWTARLGEIAALTRTIIAGPVRPTLSFYHVPLPIDLVLAPGGGAVKRRPLLGSDHAGIVANVALERR